jgi:hypothetical protein
MDEEREKVEKHALEHARAMGCDCQPDISYVKTGENGGIMSLKIAHDADCALMQEK